MRRMVHSWILATAMATGLAWGGLPASLAGAVKDEWAGPKEEQWLARAVADQLREALGQQRWQELHDRLAAAAVAWAACDRLEKLDAAMELVHAMRACKYMAILEGESKEPQRREGRRGRRGEPARDPEADRKLAQWLLKHKDIRRLLFRGLQDVDSPRQALTAFAELQAAEPRKVLEYSNLAVAFATARTLRYYEDQPDPATTVESFLYYADPRKKFRYDVKKMPWELSRYLADTRLNVQERLWAAKRYVRVAGLGQAYFDVKYDDEHYREHKPKKISQLPFTLENLARVGGVCIEQAYYASEVCKAVGIPATIVYGTGSSGIGHAWFTFFKLNPAGTSASWDGGAGRYSSQLYFTGSLNNPATGRRIMDSELVLVGSAALLPLRRREEAETAAALAALAAEACAAGDKPADLTALTRLAEEYGNGLAEKPNAPKLDTGWIRPKRTIDRSLVEDLLDLAIRRNLAYGPAWRLIIDLRKADRLPTESLNRFFGVLIEKTAQSFPEHSCSMILQLVPTLDDAAKRENAYKRSLAVYGRRPDLKGKILLAIADDYRERGDPTKAVKVYQTAAVECIQVPDVVMQAAASAEEILLAEGKQPAAMQMYYMLFGRAGADSRAAEEIRRGTPRYRLGKRLAEMLREAGKPEAAEKILAQL